MALSDEPSFPEPRAKTDEVGLPYRKAGPAPPREELVAEQEARPHAPTAADVELVGRSRDLAGRPLPAANSELSASFPLVKYALAVGLVLVVGAVLTSLRHTFGYDVVPRPLITIAIGIAAFVVAAKRRGIW